MLPDELESYLRALTTRLTDTFGEGLVGVYLFGSAAQGAYEPGVSDLDVQAVVQSALPLETCRALAGQLSQRALPCPAPRLEFVLYPQGAVRPMTARPAFALNLNTGRALPQDHVTYDVSEESPHWFVLDIAQGREVGRALLGPPPAEVFGVVPRALVLEALATSLAWHAEHDATAPNRILNAARAWRFADANAWGSKGAGVEWAAAQTPAFPVIERAWRARHEGRSVDPAEAAAFLAFVEGRVTAARG